MSHTQLDQYLNDFSCNNQSKDESRTVAKDNPPSSYSHRVLLSRLAALLLLSKQQLQRLLQQRVMRTGVVVDLFLWTELLCLAVSLSDIFLLLPHYVPSVLGRLQGVACRSFSASFLLLHVMRFSVMWWLVANGIFPSIIHRLLLYRFLLPLYVALVLISMSLLTQHIIIKNSESLNRLLQVVGQIQSLGLESIAARNHLSLTSLESYFLLSQPPSVVKNNVVNGIKDISSVCGCCHSHLTREDIRLCYRTCIVPSVSTRLLLLYGDIAKSLDSEHGWCVGRSMVFVALYLSWLYPLQSKLVWFSKNLENWQNNRKHFDNEECEKLTTASNLMLQQKRLTSLAVKNVLQVLEATTVALTNEQHTIQKSILDDLINEKSSLGNCNARVAIIGNLIEDINLYWQMVTHTLNFSKLDVQSPIIQLLSNNEEPMTIPFNPSHSSIDSSCDVYGTADQNNYAAPVEKSADDTVEVFVATVDAHTSNHSIRNSQDKFPLSRQFMADLTDTLKLQQNRSRKAIVREISSQPSTISENICFEDAFTPEKFSEEEEIPVNTAWQISASVAEELRRALPNFQRCEIFVGDGDEVEEDGANNSSPS